MPTDVKSITESIIEYATQKNIDLIVIGKTVESWMISDTLI
jgi:K+-sensing histidine kinase KdpD